MDDRLAVVAVVRSVRQSHCAEKPQTSIELDSCKSVFLGKVSVCTLMYNTFFLVGLLM